MNIRKLLTRLVSLALIAVFLPTVAMADTWYLERKRNTFATRKGQSSTRWAKTLSDKSHRMLTLSSG